jgi:hypothetical protein
VPSRREPASDGPLGASGASPLVPQPPSASTSPDARSCEGPSPRGRPLHLHRARWALAPSLGRMSKTTRPHRRRGRHLGSAPRQPRSRPLRLDRAAGLCDARAQAGGAQHLTRTWQGTIVCVATLRDPRVRCTYPCRHHPPREITSTDTSKAISSGLFSAGGSGQFMGALNHSVWSLIQIDQPRSLLRRRRPPPPQDRRTRALSVRAPGNPPSRSSGTGYARGDDDSDGRPAPVDT